MTNKNVLIVYGSRYGSTEEISQEIANVLENKGIETQLIDLKKMKSKDWPSLESFDGVLVGSGIKIGELPHAKAVRLPASTTELAVT